MEKRNTAPRADEISLEAKPETTSRRKFIGRVGSAAAASLAVSATGLSSLAQSAEAQSTSASSNGFGNQRAQESYMIRVAAARGELAVPTPPEITNGDEQRYPNRIGNYSKGLAHNNIGEVTPASYGSFLNAVHGGQPQQFDQIQLGGTALLVDPQAGLAFDLEGTDSHQLAIGTPPSVASQTMADTMVES